MNRMLAVAFSLFSLAGSSLASAQEAPRNLDPACVEKHAAFRDEKLAKFDLNKDGKLDESERAAMRASMKAKWQEKRAERVARYDLNKDGVLDEGERAAMRKAFVGKMFTKLDVNSDGQLTAEEVKCTHLAGQFASIDTDKSGTLSLDEVVAARPMHFGRHGRHGGFRRGNSDQ